MIVLTFGVYRPCLCGFYDDVIFCACCCGVFCDDGESRICPLPCGRQERLVFVHLHFLNRILLVPRRKQMTLARIPPRVLIRTRFPQLWLFWSSWTFSVRWPESRQLASQPLLVSPHLLRIRYPQASLLAFWISSTLLGRRQHFLPILWIHQTF